MLRKKLSGNSCSTSSVLRTSKDMKNRTPSTMASSAVAASQISATRSFEKMICSVLTGSVNVR